MCFRYSPGKVLARWLASFSPSLQPPLLTLTVFLFNVVQYQIPPSPSKDTRHVASVETGLLSLKSDAGKNLDFPLPCP